MQDFKTFISEHFKSIILICSFLITIYVQHVTNMKTISEIQARCEIFEDRLEQQDEQLNNLKIDRASYQSTIEQVSLVREDIKELRTDVKELLKKR